jgi:hypothetical protein
VVTGLSALSSPELPGEVFSLGIGEAIVTDGPGVAALRVN